MKSTISVATFLTAMVTVSALTARRNATSTVIGRIGDFQPRGTIRIVGEQFNPAGFTLTLRDTTFEGFAAGSAPHVGALVSVRYRMVGERRPVADRVRLLKVR